MQGKMEKVEDKYWDVVEASLGQNLAIFQTAGELFLHSMCFGRERLEGRSAEKETT